MALKLTIPYTTPGNYTFDSGKIAVDGEAKLVLQQNAEDFNEDFADDTGFTYNSSKSEFSGGQVQQKDQRPAGSPSFGSNYGSSVNANWGGGSLTGTAVGGAAVSSSGKLDLSGFSKYVDYSATGNANTAQVGAVRFKFTPNYSTKPVGGWNIFFTICNAAGSLSNRIEFRQSSSAGQLQFRLNNSSGGSIGTFTLANWNPTAGVTYEFEYNWDFTGGTHRVFIDGVQFASFTATGTRSTASTLLRVGADYNAVDESDGLYDDFVVFPTVQHTANYTPGYTVPDNPYAEDAITLPSFAHSGPAGSTIKAFDTFSTTEGGSPRYTLSVDGGAYKYWNGSTWATSDGTYSQASPATDVATNVPTLPGGDGATSLTVKVHTPDGATQASVADLTWETTAETTYPTDNPSIVVASGTAMDGIVEFTETSTVGGSDLIKYILQKDGQGTYWNGSAWVNSDGTYAQSSTAAEIEANKASYPFDAGGNTIKVKAFLHSDDGSTRPLLDEVVLCYDFAPAELTPPNECIVYGWVLDAKGEPVVGAEVLIDHDPFFHGEALILAKALEITTDSEGYWEASLVETTTIAKTMDIRITFNTTRNRRFTQEKTVTVPDQSTVNFATL